MRSAQDLGVAPRMCAEWACTASTSACTWSGTGTGPTQIFNLGHGISQHTPPDHVQALVEAVHAHSAHMRGATPKS